MMRLLLLLLFALPAFGQTQAWSSLISAPRAAIWTTVGATIVDRQITCTTLAAGATAAAIGTAITNCANAGGGVVRLAAGTFNLSSGIAFAGNNVTLRGAGPNATFLVFTGGATCTYDALICMRGPWAWAPFSPQNTATWSSTNGVSGTYAQGATTIYLSSKANLSAGSVILLYQDVDVLTDTWPEVWQCATPGTCSTEGEAYPLGYAQSQVVTVKSVSTATTGPFAIVIDQPIYHASWRVFENPLGVTHTPRAMWHNVAGYGMGLEDLSVQSNAGSTGQTSNISMSNVRNSWIKNVRSINADRNHVGIFGSTQVSVVDSYTFGAKGTGNLSYGIEPAFSSAFLLQNNIHHNHQGAILTTQGASGGVVAYNYQIASRFCISSGMMNASGWHHSLASDYILWEGNDFNGYTADAIHGTSHFATLFRNRLNGYDAYQCGATASTWQTVPVHIYAFARYANVIGNVLGDDRANHNTYESYATSTTSSAQVANQSIFMLGFSGNQQQATTATFGVDVPNDVRVRSSLFRWGNWDTVGDAARWNSAEVPTALTKYANTVPATQTLPASFYLGAKPAWFGSVPWPAIGSDVTSGRANVPATGAEGKFYLIPARVCFEAMLGAANAGTTPVLTFNGNACYSGTVIRPNPPTNVIVTHNDRTR